MQFLSKQVAFSACYRLYSPGIEFQLGRDFSKPMQTGPGGSTSLP